MEHTQETQKYQKRSRDFLAKAHAELAAGDLEQASEKGWGAAAVMVKAVAQARGWEHKEHRHLRRAVRTLAKESNDKDLRPLFQVANDLHTNFYEHHDDADEVAADLSAVGTFVDKVERFL